MVMLDLTKIYYRIPAQMDPDKYPSCFNGVNVLRVDAEAPFSTIFQQPGLDGYELIHLDGRTCSLRGKSQKDDDLDAIVIPKGKVGGEFALPAVSVGTWDDLTIFELPGDFYITSDGCDDVFFLPRKLIGYPPAHLHQQVSVIADAIESHLRQSPFSVWECLVQQLMQYDPKTQTGIDTGIEFLRAFDHFFLFFREEGFPIYEQLTAADAALRGVKRVANQLRNCDKVDLAKELEAKYAGIFYQLIRQEWNFSNPKSSLRRLIQRGPSGRQDDYEFGLAAIISQIQMGIGAHGVQDVKLLQAYLLSNDAVPFYIRPLERELQPYIEKLINSGFIEERDVGYRMIPEMVKGMNIYLCDHSVGIPQQSMDGADTFASNWTACSAEERNALLNAGFREIRFVEKYQGPLDGKPELAIIDNTSSRPVTKGRITNIRQIVSKRINPSSVVLVCTPEPAVVDRDYPNQSKIYNV